MGLPKGSKLYKYCFYTVENGCPSKFLLSFKCTPYNLNDCLLSVVKKVALFVDLSDCNCDWRKPLVVTDCFKHPVVGPFSDIMAFSDVLSVVSQPAGL